MSRIRKEPNRYWSKEEKYKIVLKVVKDFRSTVDVAKEYDISQSMLSKWVRRYLKDGIKGLENKKKPGNPLCKYSSRKNPTEIEKLEYENMKLRIEVERLKKGYQVKGDGSVVIFKK